MSTSLDGQFPESKMVWRSISSKKAGRLKLVGGNNASVFADFLEACLKPTIRDNFEMLFPT